MTTDKSSGGTQINEDGLLQAYVLPLRSKNKKRLFKTALLKECETTDFSLLSLTENSNISQEEVNTIMRLYKKYEDEQAVYSITTKGASINIEVNSSVHGYKNIELDGTKNCLNVTLKDGYRAESHSTTFFGDITASQSMMRALRAYVCPDRASKSCDRIVDAKKNIKRCHHCLNILTSKNTRMKKKSEEKALENLQNNITSISPAFGGHIENQLERKERGRFHPYKKR